MPEPQTLNPVASPWPHRLAVLLCCATFPLVWVGGLVTTYQAGMAVPDWPNTYGYNLFLYPVSTWLGGPWDLFVEHGHRLFASLVGLLTIAFCVSVWATRQPKWLRVLALVALAGVIAQGVLGGMRVLMDERTLAKIHGCVGPAFFAFTAVLATVTSRRWRIAVPSPLRRGQGEGAGSGEMAPSSSAFVLLVIALPVLAYLQLVLGAQLRHFAPDGGRDLFRFFLTAHIVVAAALTFHILATSYLAWRQHPRATGLVVPATALVVLILLQLTLGAATWVVKYGPPAFMSTSDFAADYVVQENSFWKAQITTAHVATGSLILAISTVLAVKALNALRSTVRSAKPQAEADRIRRSPLMVQSLIRPFTRWHAHHEATA